MNETAYAFRGRWITNETFADLPPVNVFHRQLDTAARPAFDANLANRHVLFRKRFTLARPEGATLRVTADDHYKLYVNGVFVAQGPSPDYPFHYLYNEIDLSPHVRAGENVLAVHTYYQGLVNRVWVSGDRRHGLLFDLCSDGRPVAVSDESVLCREHAGYAAAGKAGYDTQFLERYDAAAPEVGFARPDFDDAAWTPARLRRHVDYALFPQPTKPLVYETVRPARVEKRGETYFADFGGLYVGYLDARAKGAPGSEITMRFGQELNDDGTVRHALRANCDYVEYFKLSGGDDALDAFDYKSFRYVELDVPPGGAVDEASLALRARHYPFQPKARRKYDDPKAKAVWDLCCDTLRYGVQEVIQDCMEREKGYYLGDGCYSLLTWCLLNDDYSLMEKFFDDFLRTSFVNRGLMTVANCSMMQEIAEYPLILFTTLLEYAHLTKRHDFIRERFDAFADILDYYREAYAEEDGLLNRLDKWCVVEWPANMRDGYDVDLTEGKRCDTKHNVLNAYYIGAIKCLNKVAGLIGRAPYADAAPLERAFVAAFYDPARKLFRDRVDGPHIALASNVIPLWFELFPEAEGTAAALALIREKRLSQSLFFVTFPMFCSLLREGEEALVHDLLTDDAYWLHMLAEGATRTFEGWSKELKWNTSLFHLTLSYGAAFMLDWDAAEIFRFQK